MFLHYLGKSDQAKYVLDTQKCEKNIPDIIDLKLKKDYHIFLIFGLDILDTTGY